MSVANRESETRIDEIADGIYRICTPVPPSAFPGGFTFNQFLIDDDEPLLFHSGLRRTLPLVREAMDPWRGDGVEMLRGLADSLARSAGR